jgi:hypothetical protein
VKEGLSERLQEGEKLLWMRMPSGGRWKKGLIGVQVTGHVLLSVVSVLFAMSFPGHWALQILLGVVLFVSTNAPLVVWSVYRLPKVGGSGDAILFVTDMRVGKLRRSGELRQAPICPGLQTAVRAGVVEFRLGERTPVSFAGMSREETLLVTSVVQGLVGKTQEDDES